MLSVAEPAGGHLRLARVDRNCGHRDAPRCAVQSAGRQLTPHVDTAAGLGSVQRIQGAAARPLRASTTTRSASRVSLPQCAVAGGPGPRPGTGPTPSGPHRPAGREQDPRDCASGGQPQGRRGSAGQGRQRAAGHGQGEGGGAAARRAPLPRPVGSGARRQAVQSALHCATALPAACPPRAHLAALAACPARPPRTDARARARPPPPAVCRPFWASSWAAAPALASTR